MGRHSDKNIEQREFEKEQHCKYCLQDAVIVQLTFNVLLPAVFAPVIQTIVEMLSDTTSQAMPPNDTITSDATLPNPLPVIVTFVPPVVLPCFGSTELTNKLYLKCQMLN